MKKLHRIDSSKSSHTNILNHCKSYNQIIKTLPSRKTHKATRSQVQPIHEFTGFVRSERASMEMRILKEKVLNRKERKKEELATNEDSMKILAIYEKIKFFYHKLSTMFQTNESKLTTLLVKHIKREYYIFAKEILQIIRGLRLNKECESICFHQQPKKLMHEMNKFREFLESFYERKCTKQIQIVEDNILQREEAIRYQTSISKYKRITQSFRPSLITNSIDIEEELKQMSEQNGTFQELSKVQSSLFRKLRQTDSKISRVFQSVCNSKQKDHFLIRVEDV